MIERLDSADEPSFSSETRPKDDTRTFLTYLGSGIAGLIGGIISATIFVIWFSREVEDNPELGTEWACISGLCLFFSLAAGPALGLASGRIVAHATRNKERTFIRTGGIIVSGFIGGLLYLPIILLTLLLIDGIDNLLS